LPKSIAFSRKSSCVLRMASTVRDIPDLGSL
jgi:hypothetical protein